MRSDWPAGFNEECIQAPCEIFLQLFIENPIVGDVVILDDEADPYEYPQAPHTFLNDVDSDHSDDLLYLNAASSPDVLDFSLLASLSEDSTSEASDSGTEATDELPSAEPCRRGEELPSAEPDSRGEESSSAEPDRRGEESSSADPDRRSEESSSAEPDKRGEESSSTEPDRRGEVTSATECSASGTSDTANEMSVCDAETREELSAAELHCKETASKLSDEDTSLETWLQGEYSALEEYHERLERPLELDCSSLSSYESEHSEEASSNDSHEGTDNCARITPLSSILSNRSEPLQVIKPVSTGSGTSTYVALSVIDLPTNVSNGGSSSSNLFPALMPVCCVNACSNNVSYESLAEDHPVYEPRPVFEPYPLKPIENIPANYSHEICTCVEEMIAQSKSSARNTSSNKCGNENNMLLSDSDTDDSDYQVFQSKSESKVTDDRDLTMPVSDSSQSENTGLENEACDETFTDKSIVQNKRKVSTSSEENVIHKVPKYSSETPTDSVNVQESVASYCKVLSNNSEKQMPIDADKTDIVPPAVTGDNVLLTLGKAVETSDINEQSKSR